MVVAVCNKQRKEQKFKDKDEAYAFYEKNRASFVDRGIPVRIGVVSCLIPFPLNPEKKKPKGKNVLWCPYCGEFRDYIKNDRDYMACEFCHVSDAEFYVVKMNNLWAKDRIIMQKGKRKRISQPAK